MQESEANPLSRLDIVQFRLQTFVVDLGPSGPVDLGQTPLREQLLDSDLRLAIPGLQKIAGLEPVRRPRRQQHQPLQTLSTPAHNALKRI